MLPSNITADLQMCQQSLWRACGLSGARLLPPLLPLYWLSSLPTMRMLRTLRVAYPDSLIFGDWQWKANCLLYSVTPHPLFFEVGQLCRDLVPPRPPLPLLLRQGIVVVWQREGAESQSTIARLAPLTHQKARAAALVLLAIDWDPSQWWRAIGWCELYSKWIRMRAPARSRRENSGTGVGVRSRHNVAFEHGNRPARASLLVEKKGTVPKML